MFHANKKIELRVFCLFGFSAEFLIQRLGGFWDIMFVDNDDLSGLNNFDVGDGGLECEETVPARWPRLVPLAKKGFGGMGRP